MNVWVARVVGIFFIAVGLGLGWLAMESPLMNCPPSECSSGAADVIMLPALFAIILGIIAITAKKKS